MISVYKRHTPFSIVIDKINVQGNNLIIPKKGDLLSYVYFTRSNKRTQLMETWDPETINTVSLYLGDRFIDKQDSFFTQSVAPLTLGRTYAKSMMSFNTSFYPLQFFFCNDLPFPLISLQKDDLRLVLDWKPSDDYYYECWICYIYLGEEERRWFSQTNMMIDIYQVTKVSPVGEIIARNPVKFIASEYAKIPLTFQYGIKVNGSTTLDRYNLVGAQASMHTDYAIDGVQSRDTFPLGSMTSDSQLFASRSVAGNFLANASSNTSTNRPFRAFDGSDSTSWLSGGQSTTGVSIVYTAAASSNVSNAFRAFDNSDSTHWISGIRTFDGFDQNLSGEYIADASSNVSNAYLVFDANPSTSWISDNIYGNTSVSVSGTYIASASTGTDSALAFDLDSGTQWNSTTGLYYSDTTGQYIMNVSSINSSSASITSAFDQNSSTEFESNNTIVYGTTAPAGQYVAFTGTTSTGSAFNAFDNPIISTAVSTLPSYGSNVFIGASFNSTASSNNGSTSEFSAFKNDASVWSSNVGNATYGVSTFSGSYNSTGSTNTTDSWKPTASDTWKSGASFGNSVPNGTYTITSTNNNTDAWRVSGEGTWTSDSTSNGFGSSTFNGNYGCEASSVNDQNFNQAFRALDGDPNTSWVSLNATNRRYGTFFSPGEVYASNATTNLDLSRLAFTTSGNSWSSDPTSNVYTKFKKARGETVTSASSSSSESFRTLFPDDGSAWISSDQVPSYGNALPVGTYTLRTSSGGTFYQIFQRSDDPSNNGDFSSSVDANQLTASGNAAAEFAFHYAAGNISSNTSTGPITYAWAPWTYYYLNQGYLEISPKKYLTGFKFFEQYNETNTTPSQSKGISFGSDTYFGVANVGTYFATSSSYQGTQYAYKTFDSGVWQSTTGKYSATTGAPSGAASTTITTPARTATGEWVQLEANSTMIFDRIDASTTATAFTIVGSTNGSTWIQLFRKQSSDTVSTIVVPESSTLYSYKFLRMIVETPAQIPGFNGTVDGLRTAYNDNSERHCDDMFFDIKNTTSSSITITAFEPFFANYKHKPPGGSVCSFYLIRNSSYTAGSVGSVTPVTNGTDRNQNVKARWTYVQSWIGITTEMDFFRLPLNTNIVIAPGETIACYFLAGYDTSANGTDGRGYPGGDHNLFRRDDETLDSTTDPNGNPVNLDGTAENNLDFYWLNWRDDGRIQYSTARCPAAPWGTGLDPVTSKYGTNRLSPIRVAYFQNPTYQTYAEADSLETRYKGNITQPTSLWSDEVISKRLVSVPTDVNSSGGFFSGNLNTGRRTPITAGVYGPWIEFNFGTVANCINTFTINYINGQVANNIVVYGATTFSDTGSGYTKVNDFLTPNPRTSDTVTYDGTYTTRYQRWRFVFANTIVNQSATTINFNSMLLYQKDYGLLNAEASDGGPYIGTETTGTVKGEWFALNYSAGWTANRIRIRTPDNDRHPVQWSLMGNTSLDPAGSAVGWTQLASGTLSRNEDYLSPPFTNSTAYKSYRFVVTSTPPSGVTIDGGGSVAISGLSILNSSNIAMPAVLNDVSGTNFFSGAAVLRYFRDQYFIGEALTAGANDKLQKFATIVPTYTTVGPTNFTGYYESMNWRVPYGVNGSFSITGTIVVQITGSYTFKLQARKRSNLYINHSATWWTQTPNITINGDNTVVESSPISLTAATNYPFVLIGESDFGDQNGIIWEVKLPGSSVYVPFGGAATPGGPYQGTSLTPVGSPVVQTAGLWYDITFPSTRTVKYYNISFPYERGLKSWSILYSTDGTNYLSADSQTIPDQAPFVGGIFNKIFTIGTAFSAIRVRLLITASQPPFPLYIFDKRDILIKNIMFFDPNGRPVCPNFGDYTNTLGSVEYLGSYARGPFLTQTPSAFNWDGFAVNGSFPDGFYSGTDFLTISGVPYYGVIFRMDFPYFMTVKRYSFVPNVNDDRNTPSNFGLVGLNSSDQWVIVDSRGSANYTPTLGEPTTLICSSPGSYKAYALLIQRTNGGDSINIRDIRFFGDAGSILPGGYVYDGINYNMNRLFDSNLTRVRTLGGEYEGPFSTTVSGTVIRGEWVQHTFPSSQGIGLSNIIGYTITTKNSRLAGWVLAYTTDTGASPTWTLMDRRSNNYINTNTRTFQLTTPVPNARSIRLIVTECYNELVDGGGSFSAQLDISTIGFEFRDDTFVNTAIVDLETSAISVATFSSLTSNAINSGWPVENNLDINLVNTRFNPCEGIFTSNVTYSASPPRYIGTTTDTGSYKGEFIEIDLKELREVNRFSFAVNPRVNRGLYFQILPNTFDSLTSYDQVRSVFPVQDGYVTDISDLDIGQVFRKSILHAWGYFRVQVAGVYIFMSNCVNSACQSKVWIGANALSPTFANATFGTTDQIIEQSFTTASLSVGWQAFRFIGWTTDFFTSKPFNLQFISPSHTHNFTNIARNLQGWMYPQQSLSEYSGEAANNFVLVGSSDGTNWNVDLHVANRTTGYFSASFPPRYDNVYTLSTSNTTPVRKVRFVVSNTYNSNVLSVSNFTLYGRDGRLIPFGTDVNSLSPVRTGRYQGETTFNGIRGETIFYRFSASTTVRNFSILSDRFPASCNLYGISGVNKTVTATNALTNRLTLNNTTNMIVGGRISGFSSTFGHVSNTDVFTVQNIIGNDIVVSPGLPNFRDYGEYLIFDRLKVSSINAGTNQITITSPELIEPGMDIRFYDIAGGWNLDPNAFYRVISKSGSAIKVTSSADESELDITSTTNPATSSIQWYNRLYSSYGRRFSVISTNADTNRITLNSVSGISVGDQIRIVNPYTPEIDPNYYYFITSISAPEITISTDQNGSTVDISKQNVFSSTTTVTLGGISITGFDATTDTITLSSSTNINNLDRIAFNSFPNLSTDYGQYYYLINKSGTTFNLSTDGTSILQIPANHSSDTSATIFSAAASKFAVTGYDALSNELTLVSTTNLSVGDRIRFTSFSIPGLDTTTDYYVISIGAGNKIKVSLSDGGQEMSIFRTATQAVATTVTTKRQIVGVDPFSVDSVDVVNNRLNLRSVTNIGAGDRITCYTINPGTGVNNDFQYFVKAPVSGGIPISETSGGADVNIVNSFSQQLKIRVTSTIGTRFSLVGLDRTSCTFTLFNTTNLSVADKIQFNNIDGGWGIDSTYEYHVETVGASAITIKVNSGDANLVQPADYDISRMYMNAVISSAIGAKYAVTAYDATNDQITLFSKTNLRINDRIRFSSILGNLDTTTIYYIVDIDSASNKIKISLSPSGPVIDLTGTATTSATTVFIDGLYYTSVVNFATDELTLLPAPSGLLTANDRLQIVSGNPGYWGIDTNVNYFIQTITGSVLKLSLTSGGTVYNIGSAASTTYIIKNTYSGGTATANAETNLVTMIHQISNNFITTNSETERIFEVSNPGLYQTYALLVNELQPSSSDSPTANFKNIKFFDQNGILLSVPELEANPFQLTTEKLKGTGLVGDYQIDSSEGVLPTACFDFSESFFEISPRAKYETSTLNEGVYRGSSITSNVIGYSFPTVIGNWVQISVPMPVYAKSFSYNINNIDTAPKDITVLGSNDFITWTVLYQNTDIYSPDGPSTQLTYQLNNQNLTGSFKIYRLVVSNVVSTYSLTDSSASIGKINIDNTDSFRINSFISQNGIIGAPNMFGGRYTGIAETSGDFGEWIKIDFPQLTISNVLAIRPSSLNLYPSNVAIYGSTNGQAPYTIIQKGPPINLFGSETKYIRFTNSTGYRSYVIQILSTMENTGTTTTSLSTLTLCNEKAIPLTPFFIQDSSTFYLSKKYSTCPVSATYKYFPPAKNAWLAYNTSLNRHFSTPLLSYNPQTGAPLTGISNVATIKFPAPVRAYMYTVKNPNLNSWSLYGSNDNITFGTAIHRVTDAYISNILPTNNVFVCYITSPALYKFYRFNMDKAIIGSTSASIGGIDLYDREGKINPPFSVDSTDVLTVDSLVSASADVNGGNVVSTNEFVITFNLSTTETINSYSISSGSLSYLRSWQLTNGAGTVLDTVVDFLRPTNNRAFTFYINPNSASRTNSFKLIINGTQSTSPGVTSVSISDFAFYTEKGFRIMPINFTENSKVITNSPSTSSECLGEYTYDSSWNLPSTFLSFGGSPIGLSFGIFNGYHSENVNFFDGKTPIVSGAGASNFQSVVSATNGLINTIVRDNYSILFTGFFIPDVTGTWTFGVNSDDGIFVWIGPEAQSGFNSSNPVVSFPGVHGFESDRTGSKFFVAGTVNPVRIMYGDFLFGDDFYLWAQRPGSSDKIFNSSFFSSGLTIQSSQTNSYSGNLISNGWSVYVWYNQSVNNTSDLLNFVTSVPPDYTTSNLMITDNLVRMPTGITGQHVYLLEANVAVSPAASWDFTFSGNGNRQMVWFTLQNDWYNAVPSINTDQGSFSITGVSMTSPRQPIRWIISKSTITNISFNFSRASVINSQLGPSITQNGSSIITGEWIEIQFPGCVQISGYSVESTNMTGWTIYGTNRDDRNSWTAVDTKTSSTNGNFSVTAGPAFKIFRVVATSGPRPIQFGIFKFSTVNGRVNSISNSNFQRIDTNTLFGGLYNQTPATITNVFDGTNTLSIQGEFLEYSLPVNVSCNTYIVSGTPINWFFTAWEAGNNRWRLIDTQQNQLTKPTFYKSNLSTSSNLYRLIMTQTSGESTTATADVSSWLLLDMFGQRINARLTTNTTLNYTPQMIGNLIGNVFVTKGSSSSTSSETLSNWASSSGVYNALGVYTGTQTLGNVAGEWFSETYVSWTPVIPRFYSVDASVTDSANSWTLLGWTGSAWSDVDTRTSQPQSIVSFPINSAGTSYTGLAIVARTTRGSSRAVIKNLTIFDRNSNIISNTGSVNCGGKLVAGSEYQTTVGGQTVIGEWIQCQYAGLVSANSAIVTYNSVGSASNLYVAGSTDGTTWALVGRTSNTAYIATNNQLIPFFNTTQYNRFRFIFVSMVGTNSVNIQRIQIFNNSGKLLIPTTVDSNQQTVSPVMTLQSSIQPYTLGGILPGDPILNGYAGITGTYIKTPATTTSFVDIGVSNFPTFTLNGEYYSLNFDSPTNMIRFVFKPVITTSNSWAIVGSNDNFLTGNVLYRVDDAFHPGNIPSRWIANTTNNFPYSQYRIIANKVCTTSAVETGWSWRDPIFVSSSGISFSRERTITSGTFYSNTLTTGGGVNGDYIQIQLPAARVANVYSFQTNGVVPISWYLYGSTTTGTTGGSFDLLHTSQNNYYSTATTFSSTFTNNVHTGYIRYRLVFTELYGDSINIKNFTITTNEGVRIYPFMTQNDQTFTTAQALIPTSLEGSYTYSVSSSQDTNRSLRYLFDMNNDTVWSSVSSRYNAEGVYQGTLTQAYSSVGVAQTPYPGEWVDITFPQPTQITRFGFITSRNPSASPNVFILLGSLDGTTFTNVIAANVIGGQYTSYPVNNQSNTFVSSNTFAFARVKFIVSSVINNDKVSLTDFAVYSTNGRIIPKLVTTETTDTITKDTTINTSEILPVYGGRYTGAKQTTIYGAASGAAAGAAQGTFVGEWIQIGFPLPIASMGDVKFLRVTADNLIANAVILVSNISTGSGLGFLQPPIASTQASQALWTRIANNYLNTTSFVIPLPTVPTLLTNGGTALADIMRIVVQETGPTTSVTATFKCRSIEFLDSRQRSILTALTGTTVNNITDPTTGELVGGRITTTTPVMFGGPYRGAVTTGTTKGEYIQIQFPIQITSNGYAVEFGTPSPIGWQVFGSQNGSTWTSLDVRSRISQSSVSNFISNFQTVPTVQYQYFRLVITEYPESTTTFSATVKQFSILNANNYIMNRFFTGTSTTQDLTTNGVVYSGNEYRGTASIKDTSGEWIKLKLPTTTTRATNVTLTINDPTTDVTEWRVYKSNDGIDWTLTNTVNNTQVPGTFISNVVAGSYGINDNIYASPTSSTEVVLATSTDSSGNYNGPEPSLLTSDASPVSYKAAWAQLEYPAPTTLSQINFTTGSSFAGGEPIGAINRYALVGSLNYTQWYTIVPTRTGELNFNQNVPITFSPVTYRYYRLLILSVTIGRDFIAIKNLSDGINSFSTSLGEATYSLLPSTNRSVTMTGFNSSYIGVQFNRVTSLKNGWLNLPTLSISTTIVSQTNLLPPQPMTSNVNIQNVYGNNTLGSGSEFLFISSNSHPIRPSRYFVRSIVNDSWGYPITWRLEGSMDGISYDLLDTKTRCIGTTENASTLERPIDDTARNTGFAITTTKSYTTFRLTISEVLLAFTSQGRVGVTQFYVQDFQPNFVSIPNVFSLPMTSNVTSGTVPRTQANTYSTTTGNPLNTYNQTSDVIGEWVQLSLPKMFPIQPSVLRYKTTQNLTYTLLASNNQINWTKLIEGGTMTGTGTASITTTNSFLYFRVVVTKINSPVSGQVSIDNIQIQDVLGQRRNFVIPFCLKTNSLYHSGSLNFSMLNSFELTDNVGTDKMYAVSHNILALENGSAELVFR